MTTPALLAFKYGYASTLFATGEMDWLTADICAMLVTAEYTPAANTDRFVSDIPSGAIVVRDIVLTNLQVNQGVCAGEIPQQNSLVSATAVNALVIYAKTGSDGSSTLIYYSANGSGFPFLPTGFDYAILFDQSQGGWFKI